MTFQKKQYQKLDNVFELDQREEPKIKKKVILKNGVKKSNQIYSTTLNLVIIKIAIIINIIIYLLRQKAII